MPEAIRITSEIRPWSRDLNLQTPRAAWRRRKDFPPTSTGRPQKLGPWLWGHGGPRIYAVLARRLSGWRTEPQTAAQNYMAITETAESPTEYSSMTAGATHYRPTVESGPCLRAWTPYLILPGGKTPLAAPALAVNTELLHICNISQGGHTIALLIRSFPCNFYPLVLRGRCWNVRQTLP